MSFRVYLLDTKEMNVLVLKTAPDISVVSEPFDSYCIYVYEGAVDGGMCEVTTKHLYRRDRYQIVGVSLY